MIFWKRKASIVQPRQVSSKQLELEIAKQILQEVFHARPSDVEEMIQPTSRRCANKRATIFLAIDSKL